MIEDSLEDFNREDFKFQGNYRGTVEDNNDPLKMGRLRIRIDGLHSPFLSETEVSHLPWAYQASSLYWSGGEKIDNTDQDAGRYLPTGGETNKLPLKTVTQLTPSIGYIKDEIETKSGTGGIFTVPRKGNRVWVFFENGDHNKPHYWAMATKQQDWIIQKNKITTDINDRRKNVSELRNKFTPDTSEHKGKTPSNNASVNTFCSKPRANIYPIDNISVENITSFTSKNGTTFIIVNEKGKERYYIINKGSSEFISEYGHKKTVVGTTTSDGKTIQSNNEELVAGHKELHIVGDYDTFVNGNLFLQTEGHHQSNIKKNFGIYVKEGDVDIIIEKGNANVDVIKGNMNAHVGKNLQSQVDGDSITKVKGNYDVNVGGDLSYNVDGKTTVYSKGDIVNKSDGNIHNNSGKDFSIKSQNYELEASQSISSKGLTQKLSSTTVNVNLTPVEFVVGIGASIFKVDSAGFGGTIQMSVPISNAYHTGCFPGPGSGPSTPYIGVATPALPVSAISTKGTLQFVESPKSSNVSTDTSKNEKDDKVDSEGNPDITSNP
jgi:hypothetical protein